MTLFSKHKLNGQPDPDGRWSIVRMINGEARVEVCPDFHSARRRLGQMAREQRRKATELRRIEAGGQRRKSPMQRRTSSHRRHVVKA